MLQFFNSLSRQTEAFKPLKRGKVTMYNCGPTVYNYVHIGNLRSFLFAELLRRYLEHKGYAVTQVMNLTDVGHMLADADVGEDRMEVAAAKSGKTPQEVADFYADAFFRDIDRLGIRRASVYPRASQHVPEMIAIIGKLLANGHAYKVEENGGTSVYYDVSSFPNYGKLSGNTIEGLNPGARVDVRQDKKHPSDFALWIHNPQHLMQWEAPWGQGYPGWHIECSAMSTKYLGDTIDIHTGGEDNKFPHHECEIAQTEGATGKQFVRYWLHVMHLLVDGEKMSKSKDNFFTLGELEAKGYAPREIRYLLLSTHYRQQPNFTFNGLDAARGALKRLDDFADALKHAISESSGRPASHGKKAVKAIDAALDDDMNVAKALAGIFDYVHFINEKMAGGGTPSAQRRAPGPDIQRAPKASSKLTERDRLAALDFLKAVTDIFGFELGQDVDFDKLPESTKELIARRDAARQEKRFAEADRFRDELKAKGFIVEDTPEGRRIKRA